MSLEVDSAHGTECSMNAIHNGYGHLFFRLMKSVSCKYDRWVFLGRLRSRLAQTGAPSIWWFTYRLRYAWQLLHLPAQLPLAPLTRCCRPYPNKPLLFKNATTALPVDTGEVPSTTFRARRWACALRLLLRGEQKPRHPESFRPLL